MFYHYFKSREELFDVVVDRFAYGGRYPKDIAAGRIAADLSAAIHSGSFARMTKEEQAKLLQDLINETMYGDQ